MPGQGLLPAASQPQSEPQDPALYRLCSGRGAVLPSAAFTKLRAHLGSCRDNCVFQLIPAQNRVPTPLSQLYLCLAPALCQTAVVKPSVCTDKATPFLLHITSDSPPLRRGQGLSGCQGNPTFIPSLPKLSVLSLVILRPLNQLIPVCYTTLS